MELERIALTDEYFIEKKLYPNIDFYSGITLKAIGFPTTMFTVLFALARTVGWIAQWKEMIEDPPQKIGRPRQLYTGAPRARLRAASKRRRAAPPALASPGTAPCGPPSPARCRAAARGAVVKAIRRRARAKERRCRSRSAVSDRRTSSPAPSAPGCVPHRGIPEYRWFRVMRFGSTNELMRFSAYLNILTIGSTRWATTSAPRQAQVGASRCRKRASARCRSRTRRFPGLAFDDPSASRPIAAVRA